MSFQDQLWKLLNSGIGLLISGFVLTTLAGTYLTTWYKRESKKHEVRFIQLHEDRAKAIKKLHDKAIEVEKALKDRQIAYVWEQSNGITSQEVWEKIQEFDAIFGEHKIYFSNELCNLIDKISGKLTLSWFDVLLKTSGSESVSESPLSIFVGEMSRDLNILIESLRHEFRIILGVE